MSGGAPAALDELAALDQWVVWRRVTRKNKVDKVPFDARTRRRASSTDISTWASYAQVCAAAGDFDGIGFVFSEHDPYAGVDLDDCRDPATGALHPLAQDLIARLGSYTEVSPSGRGVKVWVRGMLPRNVGATSYPGAPFRVELYSSKRYFTVTGQQLAGTPGAIREAQGTLDDLYHTLRPEKLTPAPRPRPAREVSPGEAAAEQLTAAEIAARFNDAHGLAALLIGYGAIKTSGGYSCPFCEHTHVTTLTIAPGGRRGYSHSPRCKLYHSQGFDALNVYAVAEHGGSIQAAIRALSPSDEHRGARQVAARPALSAPGPEQVQARRREAERKREARLAHAQQIREAVIGRAAEDIEMPRGARRLLDIHLTIAGTRCWHRASVARQAELVGYSERWVQIANRYLVEHGYLDRQETSGTTTAIWTFQAIETRSPVQMSGEMAEGAAARSPVQMSGASDRSPVLEHVCDSISEPDHACEGGAVPTLSEVAAPESLESWSWYDVVHGPDELTALDTPAPAQAPQAVAEPGGASYDPARDWVAGGQLDLSDWRDPCEMRVRDDAPPAHELPEPEPLVRCPPTDPEQRRRYFALRGKARRTQSTAQRALLQQKAEALTVWLPVGQALAMGALEVAQARPAPAVRDEISARAAPPSQAPTAAPLPPLLALLAAEPEGASGAAVPDPRGMIARLRERKALVAVWPSPEMNKEQTYAQEPR